MIIFNNRSYLNLFVGISMWIDVIKTEIYNDSY